MGVNPNNIPGPLTKGLARSNRGNSARQVATNLGLKKDALVALSVVNIKL